jgi:ketopantoate reductase
LSSARKILIVGAGAIGQVFGTHLTRGGAQVSVLVKPGQETAAAGGFRLWRVRRRRQPAELHFEPAEVLVSSAPTAASEWDSVLLCVSSDALRSDWIEELAAATSPAALLSVGQSARDAKRLSSLVGERAGQIVPALFAWSAPLAAEVPGPGTAFWLPPRASQLIGASPARARPLVEAFKAGGLRSEVAADAESKGAHQAAATMPFIAALGAKQWSFRALRGDRLLEVAAKAAQEAEAAIAGAENDRGKSRTPSVRAARLALRLLPLMAPFDLEAYARRHFNKVAPQTDLMFDEWIALARDRGIETDALEELAAVGSAGPHGSEEP